MSYIHTIKEYDNQNVFPAFNGHPARSTVSLWFNGCNKTCAFCWNAKTRKRDLSLYEDNHKIAEKVLEMLDSHFDKDLALLGGDPLEYSSPVDAPEGKNRNNIEDVLEILEIVKTRRPQTRVICWTGYTWEEVMDNPTGRRIMNERLIDILIDGRFEVDKLVEGRMYGSSNQRVIDVDKTMSQNGEIAVVEGV